MLLFWTTIGHTAESPDDAALEARVRQLARLTTGATDLDVPLSSLFAIDLNDPGAVRERLDRLDQQITDLTKTLPVIATSSTSTTAVTPTERAAMLEYRVLALERDFLETAPDLRQERIRAAEASFEARVSSRTASEAAVRAEAEARDAEREKRQALQDAQRARTEALKSLKARRAQIAETMSTLAGRSQKISEAKQSSNATKRRAFARMTAHVQATRHTITASMASSMYDETTLLLDRALLEIEAALQRHGDPLDLPEIDTTPPTLDPEATAEEREASFEVKEALQSFATYTKDIETAEHSARAADVETWLLQVEALSQARERVLHALVGADRDPVFSISMSSAREAQREFRAVQLTTRARIATRIQQVQRIAAQVTDFSVVGHYLKILVKVLLVAIAAITLRRRVPRLRRWLEAHQFSYSRSLAWVRRIATLRHALDRYASPVLFIAALHLGYWWIDGFGEFIEAELVYTIVVWFSYYWLVRVFVSDAIVFLVRRRLVTVAPALRRKIERSTIVVGRVGFAFGLLLALEKRVLGDGVLYHHGQRLVVVAGVLVAFLLVRRWQSEIAAAYLKLRPTGALARLVDQSKDRYYSFAVVLVAFVLVAVRGAVAIGRETVLQFDQIRKALAFLFRKRLERRVEELGRFDNDIERLPQALRDAFTTDPLADGNLRCDFFPGLDKFEENVDEWRNGDAIGSFLLVAPRGYGKTTWLTRAAEICDEREIQHDTIRLQRDDGVSIATHLCACLGLSVDGDTDAIVAALNGGERRVLILDDIHLLVLRELGGYRALDELMLIFEATGENIFWMASTEDLAWRYYDAARPRRTRFRSERRLGEWPEDQIRMLLMARAAASGVVHQFQDLVVDDMSIDAANALARSSEAYARLIWDYADGCPMAACHYWLRSLVYVTDQRVRVRLFSAPDAERLAVLPEDARFVYAAIATHGVLAARHVARVLRVPETLARSTLRRGREEGMLACDAGTEQFRLSTHWYRAIIRDLRRQHLI